MLRRFRLLLGALLVVTSVGLIIPSSVAVGAPTDLDLDMVDGGGTLLLRGGEPYSITTPTSITGTADDETGVLSGLVFATPDIAIEREITNPLPATVEIDASFRQLSAGTGAVFSDGSVVAELSLAVDLDIKVFPTGSSEPLGFPGECTAEPIQLILESDGAYDPTTEQVTLAAEDFTIPEVQANSRCEQPIADGVNAELAGSGHSLSLQLQGVLPIPAPPGCDTTTDLVTSPPGATTLGEELTLTATVATVADDPECIEAAANGDVLAGAVDFIRGSSIIGSGNLDESGRAVFVTSALPAGPHTLTARYRALPPFSRSTSAPVTHQVTVDPAISTDVPEYIALGQPTEFTITASNPGSGFGSDLNDVAVTLGVFLDAPVRLERFDGMAWQELSLFPRNSARLPAFDLPAGGTHTERLRLSAGTPDLPPAAPAEVPMNIDLVPVVAPLAEPPSPSALAANSVTINFVSGDREPATFEFLGQPLQPHTIRQGQLLTGGFANIGPTGRLGTADGTMEFLIDGQVVPAAPTNLARPGNFALKTRVSGAVQATIPLPPGLPTGEHELTIRYSGDAFRLPHQETFPFTVLPAQGPTYSCFADGIPPYNLRVNVTAQANLPRAVEPGTISLDNLDIVLYADRSGQTSDSILALAFEYFEGTTNVGERGLREVSFSINGQDGTATGITSTNPFALEEQPRPAPNPDHILEFEGEVGSATIAGEPGDVVPLTLDSITLDSGSFGTFYRAVCTPVAQPAGLGDVLVSGVDLTVTPETNVREGDDVTLTADTGNPADAGVMEFLDGTDTIGVANVAGGVASITTADLDAGDHTLRARFYRTPAAPVVMSPEVPLSVLPESDCGGFTDEGAGRVVRLVYMSLLERCPDEAGYAYWVEQLEAGTTQQTFATTISKTHEARRVVANDGYQTMLGRDGSDADLDFWAGFLRTRPYRQLLAAMGDASEFRALAGSTDVGFVTRVYQRLLQRDPEPAGLEYWVSRLRAGEPDRILLTTFARLREPTAQVVTQSYAEILGRAPTSTELDAQVTLLRANGDRSALYGRLIGTSEFVVRARTLPNFPPT